jgi:hypothetical protein
MASTSPGRGYFLAGQGDRLADETGKQRPVMGREVAQAVAHGERCVDERTRAGRLSSQVIDLTELGGGQPRGYLGPRVERQ